jgi:GNAT superfamily N-acetyltransferase
MESEGSWVALSGAPSADLNMALVHGNSAATLTEVVDRVRAADVPALVMLTGDCHQDGLGEPWQPVGEMPFMASPLSPEHLRADPRVRQASTGDAAAVCHLMSDAFGLGSELIHDPIAVVLDDPGGPCKVWMLTEGGIPVSVMVSSVVGDAVTIWCMSTPERFARRGFGRALLAHALMQAKEEGAVIGLLGATPAGRPLYDATGWTVLEQWRMFTNAPSAQFGG